MTTETINTILASVLGVIMFAEVSFLIWAIVASYREHKQYSRAERYIGGGIRVVTIHIKKDE